VTDLSAGLDWSPVGGCPVSGDPDRVRVLAGDFASFAADVAVQAGLLHRLQADAGSGIWIGPAAVAALPKVGELPGELDKVVASYRAAGEAVSGYWPRLRSAQEVAVAALGRARAALERAGQAQAAGAAQQHAQQAAARSAAAAGKPAPSTAGAHDFGADAAAAQAELARAREEVRQAGRDVERAASAAADAVDAASHAGIRNSHGLFAGFKRWVHHHAGVLKVVSAVCNTLSAVCAVVAVVLPFTAPLMVPLALGFGVAGLAIDGALYAAGDGSLLDLGLDVLNVATLGGLGAVTRAATVVRTLRGGSNLLRASRLASPLRLLRPARGPLVRAALPVLEGSERESFTGGRYVLRTLRRGDVVARAENTGQGVGGFVGPVMPRTAAHAEQMSNIAKWGNYSEVARAYRVTEDVTVYAGKVAGGTGRQYLLPKVAGDWLPGRVLEPIGERPLAGSEAIRRAAEGRP